MLPEIRELLIQSANAQHDTFVFLLVQFIAIMFAFIITFWLVERYRCQTQQAVSEMQDELDRRMMMRVERLNKLLREAVIQKEEEVVK